MSVATTIASRYVHTSFDMLRSSLSVAFGSGVHFPRRRWRKRPRLLRFRNPFTGYPCPCDPRRRRDRNRVRGGHSRRAAARRRAGTRPRPRRADSLLDDQPGRRRHRRLRRARARARRGCVRGRLSAGEGISLMTDALLFRNDEVEEVDAWPEHVGRLGKSTLLWIDLERPDEDAVE